jgi:hypothetical protein
MGADRGTLRVISGIFFCMILTKDSLGKWDLSAPCAPREKIHGKQDEKPHEIPGSPDDPSWDIVEQYFCPFGSG